MKVVVVGEKEIKVNARYSDKRKAEKKIAEERKKLLGTEESNTTVKNLRPKEVQIPISRDRKTTIWIRKSRFFKKKYVELYFEGSEADAKKYYNNYLTAIKNETEN